MSTRAPSFPEMLLAGSAAVAERRVLVRSANGEPLAAGAPPLATRRDSEDAADAGSRGGRDVSGEGTS